MPKAYWVGCYRKISDQAALAEYAKLAGPAIIAGGGRFLARGGVAKVFEAGVSERTVLIEFESAEDCGLHGDAPGHRSKQELSHAACPGRRWSFDLPGTVRWLWSAWRFASWRPGRSVEYASCDANS